jgi:hypothetical protein
MTKRARDTRKDTKTSDKGKETWGQPCDSNWFNLTLHGKGISGLPREGRSSADGCVVPISPQVTVEIQDIKPELLLGEQTLKRPPLQ